MASSSSRDGPVLRYRRAHRSSDSVGQTARGGQGMASVSEGVEAFREGFDGEVVLPEDPGYDEARSVWNGDIDRRPALIVRCRSARQVADAIGLGRGLGIELTVR